MSADATEDAILADAASFVAEIERERAVVARESAEADRRGAERLAEVEDARRRGDHGRDWQVLQQRIDLRETTMSDIVDGLDHSTEARAIRTVIGEHFAMIRDSYTALMSDPDEELAAALAELARAREGLRDEVARLDLREEDNR
jgi:hypothetical protein